MNGCHAPAPALLAVGLGLFLTTACHSAIGGETRKPVTRVLIQKQDHKMKLLAADGTEVAAYSVAIGPAAWAEAEGRDDAVGRYHITMHQPSQYKIFLRLDYPTAEDFKRFNALKAAGSSSRERAHRRRHRHPWPARLGARPAEGGR